MFIDLQWQAMHCIFLLINESNHKNTIDNNNLGERETRPGSV